jgi:hypothetical protein
MDQSSEIEALRSKLRELALDVSNSFGTLSAAQINWKPRPDSWSVAQCLDHLITSNKGYLPIFDQVLSGRKSRTIWERLPLFPTLWGRLLLKSLNPASTRKLKAPKPFEPAQSDIDASVVQNFIRQQETLDEKIGAMKSLNPDKIVITSPAAGLITYTLMDAYRIVVVHEERHVGQAKRVVAEVGFPG